MIYSPEWEAHLEEMAKKLEHRYQSAAQCGHVFESPTSQVFARAAALQHEADHPDCRGPAPLG